MKFLKSDNWKFWAVLGFVAACFFAASPETHAGFPPPVQQSGAVTSGHAACWAGNLNINDCGAAPGTGSVSAVTVAAQNNGVTLSVANPTTTPALTIGGANLTPTSIVMSSATSPNLSVAYTGADTNEGVLFDCSGSSMDTQPCLQIVTKSSGHEKGFLLLQGADAFGYAMFGFTAGNGSTASPGFSVGPGVASGRDVSIFRSGANALTIGDGAGGNGFLTAGSYVAASSTIPTNGVYLPASNTLGIADNSQPVIETVGTASAVDFITVTNAATANPATETIAATGTDSNINIQINGKGTGGVQSHGSTGGTAPVSGYVGEQIRAAQTTLTNFPTNTNYGDCVSISLTAGNWDISYVLSCYANSGTVTGCAGGISTTTGNSATGLQDGDNKAEMFFNAGTEGTLTIPQYRVSISSTTTYFGKVAGFYSAGSPQYVCRISAVRVP